MKPIVLATTSRYKQALFKRLDVPFILAAPDYQEVLSADEKPVNQALRLARGKAQSLVKAFSNHLIVGADQVLALGNELFTKPMNTEAAVDQVLKLSGRTHFLHTAYCILDSSTGSFKEKVVTARLRMRGDLTREEVRGLVARDGSHDCVGGYKFESLGIQLFSAVRTPDPNAIVGLPLMALAADLRPLMRNE